MYFELSGRRVQHEEASCALKGFNRYVIDNLGLLSGTHVSGPKDGIAPPAVMIGYEFGRKSVAKATVIFHPLALKWERSCRYYRVQKVNSVRCGSFQLSVLEGHATCVSVLEQY
jgi:hypothetical protein